jgi:(p)ppGpp synthase/HD superfamily hydrolase
MGILESAIALARKYHHGQYRKYTQPGMPPEEFFVHPFSVYERVRDVPGSDEVVQAAAVLHDVVEDTACTLDEIVFHCGEAVASIVDELTNRASVDPEVKKLRRAERKQIDRDRLAKASVWAKKIKLIDRAYNLRDMGGAPDKFKAIYLNESRSLYSVLCGVDETLEAEYEQAMSDLEKSIREY